MTLQEFYDEIEKHDWFYNFSDDHSVWQRGEADWARLERIASESPEHKQLLSDSAKHRYSGEPWKTPKHPKPERPK